MAPKHTILIAEDEKNTRDGLRWGLDADRYRIMTAEDGRQAIERIRGEDVHLLLTDLKMPEIDGMELLDMVRAESPDTQVIILTGHGTVENAVEAMKKGAFDYLIKPVKLDELNMLVERVLGQRELVQENRQLREQLEERFGFENIIGNSAAMMAVFDRIRQVAPTRATVLLTGESGTGKEMVASAIHYNSTRKDRPFVRLNCGALTATLLESELFGHEAGAFTDARKQKIGRFEQADRGTIFLDEITETTPEFQVRLLRVLQEQEFERVGGTETIRVDVRVIAATNQDIEKAVRDGSFREDLYYRLNVVKIQIPPLRERPEDIPLLAQAFLGELCEQNGKAPMRIEPAAMDILRAYAWPGNVRQLRNAIEGMVVLTPGETIGPENVPAEIRGAPAAQAPSSDTVQVPVGASISEAEREMIRATLEKTGNNRAAAARILGIGRKTLYRKIEEYGLDGDDDR